MSDRLANYKDQLMDFVARYRDRADFLSIRLEQSEGSSILLRNDKIETISENTSLGGQVRVCHKGGWGFAAFNNLDDLKLRIEEAAAIRQNP